MGLRKELQAVGTLYVCLATRPESGYD